MLKNSARKSRLACSANRVVFDTEKSQLLMPCARSVESRRDSFPRLNRSGASKHAAFTMAFPALTLCAIEPAADLSQSGTTLGRTVPDPKKVEWPFVPDLT